jgi:sterol desaturase/sphingolipid hydroxylase (fatty acid hydroxylase superfamily)
MSSQLLEQLLPASLIFVLTLAFFSFERLRPGRVLPHVRGWYVRAALMNAMQLTLVGVGGLLWNKYFRDHALFSLGRWQRPVAEGAFYWLVGTFIFYWWHRLRHARGFWLVFHQSFGLLAGRMVVVGYTPRGVDRHFFSMRQANDREKARIAPLLAV